MIGKLKEYFMLFLIIALIAISIFCYFLRRELIKTADERDDFKAISKETFKSYKDEDGKTHSTSESEYLKSEEAFKQELEKYKKDFLSTLDTKLSKLDGFRIQNSKSEYHFKTFLKDTTINDTVAIKIFNQVDPKGYYTFKGEIRGDSINASLKSLDTLVTGISRGKCQNRILWGLIGISKRPMIVENVNKNPYTEITYQKEVYLQKRAKWK